MSLAFQNQNPDNFMDLYYEDIWGCVSRLQDVPIGDVWTLEQIKERKEGLLCEGRDWSVVDNLPLHEEIKQGGPNCYPFIDNYKESLVNLSRGGIKTICYAFTPLYHKLRTHFSEGFEDDYAFSFFDPVAFSVFDIYVLKRPIADLHYNGYQKHKANILYNRMTEDQLKPLTENIFKGLPSVPSGSLADLNRQILSYAEISDKDFNYNFEFFCSEIAPIAKELKIRLRFNADNPCGKLFGLPSILNVR